MRAVKLPRGSRREGYLAFQRYVNINAQGQWTGLTFTMEAIGLGLDYPPCPAYLVIYDHIIIVCGNLGSSFVW